MNAGQRLVEISDLASMQTFAASIVLQLSDRQVILLDGPMGAGKTQFTKFLLESLGSDEAVSPSFAIHNRYEIRGSVGGGSRITGFSEVDHVDLFRLESEDDLESSGFWDLFSRPQGLILIEWAERLPAASLPPKWTQLRLVFEITGVGSRRVLVSG